MTLLTLTIGRKPSIYVRILAMEKIVAKIIAKPTHFIPVQHVRRKTVAKATNTLSLISDC